MKYCQYCGKELSDDSRFCDACGTPCVQAEETQTPPPDMSAAMYAEEKQCIDIYERFLRYERLAWKITGIVLTILGGVFAFFGMIMAIADDYIGVSVGLVYMMHALFMFLPIGIISLNMISKVDYYRNTLYNDIRPTITRSESIGMLVFCFLFNNVAGAFFLVNFVRTKCNRAAISRIIRNQQGF